MKGSAGDREAANFLNIRPCQNENCFELWVGAEYGQRSNWCDAFHDHLYIKVDHPEAITGVFLSYVKWDDYFAAYIGRSGREKLLFNAGGTLPIRIRSVTDTGNLEAQQRFLNGETVYDEYSPTDEWRDKIAESGDIDGDGRIDSSDESLMLYAMLSEKETGDINADGSVDARDSSDILGYYSAKATHETLKYDTENKVKYLGDVTGDQIIDARDASDILGIYSENATR